MIVGPSHVLLYHTKCWCGDWRDELLPDEKATVALNRYELCPCMSRDDTAERGFKWPQIVARIAGLL